MWPNSAEIRDLLQHVRSGETAAVNDLLERHREALRRMVRVRLDQKLARRVDASDIVQDVLLEASVRLADYLQNPQVPFAIWLRQMALDRIIDTHRRHRVAARRSLDREQSLDQAVNYDHSSQNWAAQLAGHEITPASAALRHELEQRFLVAINQLPEEDREILLLRHFEHLTNSEAADLLGLSPPAAGMRHLRALRRLRQILGEISSP